MRVREMRRIRVSPHLGYGTKGVPGRVPENAVLVFEVELPAVGYAWPAARLSELIK